MHGRMTNLGLYMVVQPGSGFLASDKNGFVKYPWKLSVFILRDDFIYIYSIKKNSMPTWRM